MAEGRPFIVNPMLIAKQYREDDRMRSSLPRGIHGATHEAYPDHMRSQVVHSFEAFVYTSRAGQPVSDVVAVLLPLRPWWLPRFLWRRIPTRTARWTLTVTPTWAYPDADLPVPEVLGRPVEVYRSKETTWEGPEDWRATEGDDPTWSD